MVGILGFNVVDFHDKYLGLPCFSGKDKKILFAFIKDSVWNKLCGWKSKLFLARGRKLLLKVVIQSILANSMNLFLLPCSLTKELHHLSARFCWGGIEDSCKMHWCS